MSRTQTLTRALAAILAVAALAAPTALARPGGPASAAAAALSEQSQDLRHLRAGNSISGEPRDLGPAYAAPASAAAHPAALSHPATSDDGAPWMTIALAFGAACLFAGGAAAVAGGLRAHPRAT